MKKTTSENFSKRITKYGALSAAIAGITQVNAQEQIYYNNIPDELVTAGNHFTVDINNDTVGDVLFLVNSAGNGAMLFPVSSYSAYYFNYNRIVGETIGSFYYPFNLVSGEMINSTNGVFYSSRGDLYWNSCFPGSNFCNKEGFIGVHLKLPLGGGVFETYYGWIRIQVDANHNITIKDYASHTVADTPIAAGQTTTLGIEDQLFSKIKVVSFDKAIEIYNLPVSAEYRLYNISGQNLLEGTTQNKDHVIEASSLSSGVYIVELNDTKSNAVVRKKIVL